ncbi:12382_t:CDS:2, partial [Dentiscutata erythropus]
MIFLYASSFISHFKYLEAHIARIHKTTLSELQQQRNISTQRRPEETTNSHQETPNLRRDASEQLAQENTTNSADSLTPNLSQEPISISDENFILDNQISRIVFTHSTFNKCIYLNDKVVLQFQGEVMINISTEVLKINPNNEEEMLRIRAQAYIKIEKYDKALVDLNRLLEINCKNEEIL